jgi:hypothetical protein
MVVPRVPGALALLDAPDDFRCWVQLGDLYSWSIKEQRRRLESTRTGIEVFEVSAPINSPKLHVAIDRRSLYVLGWKADTSAEWWAFEEKGQLPKLPGGSVKRINGKFDYEFLGLAELASYNIQPTKLITALCSFDGKLGDREKKANVIMLLFLLSEALRFDSVFVACVGYLTQNWSMQFTAEIKAQVKDWAHSSEQGKTNVLLKHLPKHPNG